MSPVSRGLTAHILLEVPSANEPEAIYRIFGRRLREFRDQQQVSQDELAAFSNLTRSSIANIESGKQRVFLHQVLQFADRLKVSLEALVRQEDFGREAIQEESKPQMADFLERAKSELSTEGKEPPDDQNKSGEES